MLFKEYVKNLNELLKEHPETADLTVVTSKDDEGNGFNEVYYTPTLGFFEDGEFDLYCEDEEINAVCIN